MASGRPLRTRFAWEFVPYNERARAPRKSKDFIREVKKRQRVLQSDSSESGKDSALGELKRLYLREFGSSSKQRNLISVFLYAGTVVLSKSVKSGIFHAGQRVSLPLSTDWWINRHCWTTLGFASKYGILYSGDGYLNTDARIQALTAELGATRTENICVFQVMHHGAKPNWSPNVATKLSPEFSIFCSDPENKKLRHPHGEVVRGFLRNRPVLVDKQHGAVFSGCLEFQQE